MNKIRFSQLLYFGLVLVMTACQSVGRRGEMFQPGDAIDGMILTTGAKDVPPLWAFCSPVQYVGNMTTADCRVPMLRRLAIGNIFLPGDDSLDRLDWSEINWELTIDDHPIDLRSFGTYDFDLPAMSHAPSPVREVFVHFTAWDVVLTNLNPGEHIIHGLAQIGPDTYNWVIHLTIKANASIRGTPPVGPQTQEIS